MKTVVIIKFISIYKIYFKALYDLNLKGKYVEQKCRLVNAEGNKMLILLRKNVESIMTRDDICITSLKR